jgi:phytoene desaturase
MKIAIIGSGFSGLSAASYAAKEGNEVHVFEKHGIPGGRARQFKTPEGFVFDMGPSWYWMPDIIDSFFEDFGRKRSDFFELVRLDPQFQIIFEQKSFFVPDTYHDFRKMFEDIEPGAGSKLDQFMQAARYKYEVSMDHFIQKPCHSWMEFMSPQLAVHALKLDLFSDFRSYVAHYFKHPHLRTLIEFPVIFLGASPGEIPAMYSLMNYGGYMLGTHYPMGGFYQLVLAMQQVAHEQGVQFHYNQPVQKIVSEHKRVTSLLINDQIHTFDAVIASSDYHHTESLLDAKGRNYNEKYWQERTFAPSCLIYYLGIDEIIPNLNHHNLFFENSLDEHLDAIYLQKKWPENPLFYVCCPSKTDPSVAPIGKENVFLLMPLAIGLEDKEEIRENYLKEMLRRIEKQTGVSDLQSKIVYQRSYCIQDFIKDYNAYGGNAYGLANTLKQTAFWKPKLKNQKLSNMVYTGQLTVPGPGVPPSLISGKIAAKEITKK